MPVPIYRNREIGLTGRFRFRRQMLTGLSVLQVETSIRRFRYPDPTPSNDSQIISGWRDATYEEAIRIQIDYGDNINGDQPKQAGNSKPLPPPKKP
ncbi:hypothetical protein [Providencia rustigianii]|uniref:hypothetical protein n=1 Tax=Providencia rustigianii TaxID=158850 RepID=UPI00223F372E|nr:hypothetical protein [Providencia rustigianii]